MTTDRKRIRTLGGVEGAVALCFFLSGFSALIFQVVWLRKLDLVFGHTVYAVTTVLAAFMGGLALGSRLFGRIADRRENVLRLYGILEAGVGLYAVILPLLIASLTPLFRLLYHATGESFFLFSLVRFLIFCVLLLPPTTLMGGTLPVLARFFTRKERRFGRTVGFLYAWNTFGAVLGTLTGGFLLIPLLGVSRANLFAAAISVIVGIATIALSRRISPSPAATTGTSTVEIDRAGAPPSYSSFLARFVLILYAFSGLTALGYEVIWTRLLIMLDYFDSDTYSFTTMLATFLFGLSAGSLIASRFVDRSRHPERILAFVQILIGCTSLLSLFLLATPGSMIHYGQRSWESRILLYFLFSFGVMIVPTLLLGSVLPLVTRIYVRNRRDVGNRVGIAYSANTIGAIAGAVLTGFVLIPLIGTKGSLLLLSAINVAFALVLLGSVENRRGLFFGATTTVSLVVFLMLALLVPKEKLYRIVKDTDELLFYDEGNTATVTVLRHEDGSKSANVDGVPVAGTDRIMLTDQKSLAHLPSLVLKEPSSALTVGFGSGGSSWSFCQHPHMTKVRCVEIAPNVIDAAAFLLESNHGILEAAEYRSKYGIILDDAKSYLNLSGDRYDVIATDCTDLAYKSNANLYTVEYFELCRSRIEPGGAIVIWLNITGLTTFDLKTALNTFLSVYPEGSVWYFANVPTHYVLLLGTTERLSIDLTRYLERFQVPQVLRDLREVGLDDPWKFLDSYIASGPSVREWAAGGRLNTNENAYLEFSVPRTGSDEFNSANLDALLDLRQPVSTLLTNIPPGFDPGLMERTYHAGNCLLQSVSALWRLKFAESLSQIDKSRAINPSDPSLGEFEALVRSQQERFGRRIAASARADAASDVNAYNLGVFHYDRKEYEQAAGQFRRSIRLESANADAHTMLGLSLYHLGDREGAIRSLKQAVEVDPGAYKALRNLADLAREMGEMEGAEKWYQEALSVNPEYLPARANLGLLYFQQGRFNDAEEEFKEFLRVKPGDPQAEAMIGRIRAAREGG